MRVQRVKQLQDSKRTKLEEELDDEEVLSAFPSVGRSREQRIKEVEEAARYPRVLNHLMMMDLSRIRC